MKFRALLTLVSVLFGPAAGANAQETNPPPLGPRLPPFVIDYVRPPDSFEEAGRIADVVAVVRLTGRQFTGKADKLPMTEYRAQVIEVLSNRKNLQIGSHVSILRDGGVRTINGVQYLQEQHRFPLWPVGRKVVVFLGWSDDHNAFYLNFGHTFTFEEDQEGKAQTFGRGRVADLLRGRSFSEVVAEIRAAIR